ncbi:hypothetical protein JCM10908_004237 [Rhodotorula pacifica]|uniref:uncharacterized protein n=1 Tax=Rhodotorula pacifica TaxID=1495444 RepID=UPI0031777EC7
MPHQISTKRRALIIGAGASGLAAIQQALEAGLEPVCIEARSTVGGTWHFDETPGLCEVSFDSEGSAHLRVPGEGKVGVPPAPNPIYHGLRTNTPTPLMQYRGGPIFPTSVGLFCRHEDVFAYLEEFAEPLLPYIRFNTRVQSLRHTLPSDPPAEIPPSDNLGPGREGPPERRRWIAELGTTQPGASDVYSEQFDAVFVANGKYTEAYIPRIHGLATFSGSLLHSRWYRSPEQFKNKDVLIVGSSASGSDIAREAGQYRATLRASGVAEADLPRFYQSIRTPKPFPSAGCEVPSSPNAAEVTVVTQIKSISGEAITFLDGKTINDVDIIMFATGFIYSYPFADATSEPFKSFPLTRPLTDTAAASSLEHQPSDENVAGMRVHNLDDRLLFYLPDPTLVVLTAPYLVIPFPLAQIQARLAARHFADSPALPAPLKFKPNPALRGEDGSEDGAPETRQAVSWGEPFHSDMRDRMLRETGDVVDDGTASKGGQVWGLTPQADRDLVLGLPSLRKHLLGY